MKIPRWINYSRVLYNARVLAALILILSAAVMAFMAASPHAVAQQTTAPTPQADAVQLSAEESRLREDWRISMAKVPLPKKGCFESSYPRKEWQEVPCAAAPNIPMPPRQGARPFVVGNGVDIAAQAPSGFISTAIGSFDTVTNVTSESGPIGNSGPAIANAYTLQLNTNFFASTVCAGSPNAGCQGWQQFVYGNDGSSGIGFIQYWLIQYNTTCPAGQGWNQFQFNGSGDIYCWKNNTGGAVGVPNQPINNLGQLSLSGAVSAASDSITISTGGTVYAINGDNAVNAAAGWQVAEFNIFGYGGNSAGGGMASFNSGADIVARTRIISGSTLPPPCMAQGFTAETNNLSFGPTAPGTSPPGPAVIFRESTAGGLSGCAAATSVGDTHLATFGGLFYDFQATGDFVLAEVSPDFVVQTRQVSGAPTWPNASVNKAVATRMGKTQVAVCLAPAGNEKSAGLHVDGKATTLEDGKSISLPDGVDIARRGNVYLIMGQSGDSVRAVVHPTWIDVSVGLGRWPSNVRGLIANPNGNVNQIAARDGTVLTNPFPFADLYHRYADSWRVPRGESLLSVCGKDLEPGIPDKPFYASDLEPQVREKALAICTAAGVKPGPLLDACTLDVAVIGNEEAAKVFVGVGNPVALGNVVATSSSQGQDCKLCWLVVAVLLVFAFILWMLLLRRKRTTP
jgi:hypothetical protein